MKRAMSPLIKRYQGKPAIVDTNLLLLLWCADFDPELLGSFKRLSSYSLEDLGLLRNTLKHFPALRTTPHVLTEVSNLANSLPDWRKEEWAEFFGGKLEVIPEEWIPAKSIAAEPSFFLGLTDAGLGVLATSHVIITMDFPLSNYLETMRLNVINFNHLRAMQWQ
jgi:hypothetical protein